MHSLGGFPLKENAEILFEALEMDADEWVRYGAVRALAEMAALAEDPALRASIIGRLLKLGPGQGNLVKGELRHAIYNLRAPAGWGEAVLPLLSAIRQSLLDSSSLAREYERSIQEFSQGTWRTSSNE